MVMPNVPTPAVPRGLLEIILELLGGVSGPSLTSAAGDAGVQSGAARLEALIQGLRERAMADQEAVPASSAPPSDPSRPAGGDPPANPATEPDVVGALGGSAGYVLDKIMSLLGGGDGPQGISTGPRPDGSELPGQSPLFGSGASAETGLAAEFLQAVRDGTVDDFFKKHPELTLADLQDLQRALAEAPAEEGLGNDAIREKAKAGDLGDKMQEKASALTPDAIKTAREQIGAQAESRGAKFLDTDVTSLRDAWHALRAQNPEWDMTWDAFKTANSKADRANGGAIPKGTFLIVSANAAAEGERTYTAEEGDTPQKIAEKTGGSLSDIMTQLGVTDPSEQLVPGKDKVVINPPPGRAEARGEGTMPQATGAPLPGAPETPGTTGAENIPPTEDELALDMTPGEIIAYLTGEWGPAQRSQAQDLAGAYEAIVNLMAAANPETVTDSNAFGKYEALLEQFPQMSSTRGALDELAGMESVDPTSASAGYLSGPMAGGANDALSVLLMQALGARGANMLLNDDTLTALSAEFKASGAPNYVAFLKEKGWL